jgi:hypothetical protein
MNGHSISHATARLVLLMTSLAAVAVRACAFDSGENNDGQRKEK